MSVSDYRKQILSNFNKLLGSKNSYEVWDDLMCFFSASLSNPIIKNIGGPFKRVYDEREEEYLKRIGKYNKKEIETISGMLADIVMETERNPNQDLLGSLYMELGISSKNEGQFFTPYDLCRAMSEIAVDEKTIENAIQENGFIKLNDCACGAGATLIAGLQKMKSHFKNLNWQNHVIVYAQDIDVRCTRMAFIQLALQGVCAICKCGDALMNPEWVLNEDTASQYYFTPMYFSKVWQMRILFHRYDMMLNTSH